MNRLIENILLMISEDVNNIMKIVKGIVLKFTINKVLTKKKAKVIIFEYANAIFVEYEVIDNILNIIIHL